MIDQTSSTGFPFDPALRLGGLGVVIAPDDYEAFLRDATLPEYAKRQIARQQDLTSLDTRNHTERI